ncbi:PAS domain S-box-containing protein [Elusimicrobium posterum]|uniref:ATP-binding protein n=1 Tax=Elusimicrobium posterum TaxID=3116653 RepID=UPI003C76B02B
MKLLLRALSLFLVPIFLSACTTSTADRINFYISLSVAIFIISASLFTWVIARNKQFSHDLKTTITNKEEELEVKSGMLSSILQTIPDLIFYKDSKGIYTGCNPSFEKFAGVKEARLVGKTDKEIFKLDEKMADLFMQADRRIIDNKKVEIIEELITYPDGSKRLVETYKAPLIVNGKVTGIVGISRDVTARKAAEDAAQVAAKAKGEFLARMSHEIRTPLNAVIGMSNIAKNSIDNKEKTLHSIDEILTASHHLLGILNNILDMSKIESGKFEMDSACFNIATSFESVSSIITQRAGEKNIKFTVDTSEVKDLVVVGDKLRLNQVLVNLMGNAVKFTNAGGNIDFSVKIAEENDEKAAVLFTLKDDGIGMTKEQTEKLFKAFEQADNTIATRFGGTGLGLAISQNLINMMGGNIEVESKPGEGSKFYFTIPFEKNECFVSEDTEKVEKLDLASKRILLVEDIDINRIIVCDILSTTGVKIDEARNGKEAVEMFAAAPDGFYDLIFMDVQMPVLNGYEATKQIRLLDKPNAQNVPVIAMTANAYKEDVERALESGMNGHLSKPIDTVALIKTLAKYLS